MSTTLNHFALSRAQFARAREHADAGSALLARDHLRFAADHALLALAARRALEPQLDRVAIAERLADIGAAPEEIEPVLRDLDDDSVAQMQDPALTARLHAGFGLVQALIDAYVAQPPSANAPATPAPMPLYGGARGALNARGAEAAVRGLTRIATAIRALAQRARQ